MDGNHAMSVNVLAKLTARPTGRAGTKVPKLAKCQNPDCGLTVWRTVGRMELTDKQLAELLTKGKTGTIRGFVIANFFTNAMRARLPPHASLVPKSYAAIFKIQFVFFCHVVNV